MKVAFVVLGSEHLSIGMLSALAKKGGHEVCLAFSSALFHDRFNLEIPWLAKYFDDTDEVIETLYNFQPDVIGFSCLTSTYQWMLEVAAESKRLFPGVKTIFGGVHVSAVPDLVLQKEQVDFVVVGEGDVAFPAILDAIERDDYTHPIINTRYKDSGGQVVRGKQEGFIQDLNDLPFFDKEIWEGHIRIGDMYLTMASRGCPYTCSFCFNNFFAKLPEGSRGKYVRQRSVDHVIGELKWAKARYKIRIVDFQDDVFTVSKAWIKEFCQRYKEEIALPFQCLIHPQYFDEDIARWMSEAGCVWIQMGIQTMDEQFKHENLRRYEDSDHIVKALQLMRKYGIKIKVDHMLGLPGEPIESQETARKLYATVTPDRIQTFWTCFLPGTDMMKKGVADGTLSKEQADRLNEGTDFYFFRNQENISDKDLVEMYERYEFIYKILPLIPHRWKSDFDTPFVGKIPPALRRLLAFAADVLNGFRTGNDDIIAYAYHYLFHLRKSIFRVLGNISGFRKKKVFAVSESKTRLGTKKEKHALEL
jgi:anaerobic magnesium-protoporphyrin IX monomethyl ester cyclase